MMRAAADMLADQSRVRIGLTSGQRRALGITPETPPKYRFPLGQIRPGQLVSPEVLQAASEMIHAGPWKIGLTSGQRRALGIQPETPPRHRLRIKKSR
ncbi:hypothetical protein [Nocardioides sp. CER19]|uniref:hypothetical protein n=1 Tax=Nocardioides sp. CER19 TaxID=3038538 RepID=UPI00244C00E5|nr:hypothetical protein [Nocardioides sp. CER19]MDH2415287.1 hypothetical protein [Nocardioides sp. CER19]